MNQSDLCERHVLVNTTHRDLDRKPKKRVYKLVHYTEIKGKEVDGGVRKMVKPTKIQAPNVPAVKNITTVVLSKPFITEDMAKEYMKDPDKAYVDIDKIKNVGGVVRESQTKYTTTQRSGMRQFITWAYRGFKVVLGGAAMVVSFGGGGDTCTDLFFLIVDTAFLIANISSILILTYEEQFALGYVRQIYDLKWTGDPLDIQNKMGNIFTQIDGHESSRNIYTIVCNKYMNVLDTFASSFGDLISTMIPDDLGLARIIVEMIIMEGASYLGRKPFDALTWMYSKIPTSLKNVLMNEKNLKDFIMIIVSFFRNILPKTTDSWWTIFKKDVTKFVALHGAIAVGFLIPGVGLIMPIAVPVLETGNMITNFGITGEAAAKIIDKSVEPKVDSYCTFMMRVIPLVFAVVLVFDHCQYRPS